MEASAFISAKKYFNRWSKFDWDWERTDDPNIRASSKLEFEQLSSLCSLNNINTHITRAFFAWQRGERDKPKLSEFLTIKSTKECMLESKRILQTSTELISDKDKQNQFSLLMHQLDIFISSLTKKDI